MQRTSRSSVDRSIRLSRTAFRSLCWRIALAALCPVLLVTIATFAPAKEAGTQPTQPADGSITLGTHDARIHGFQLHIERRPSPHFAYWVDPTEYIEWPHGCARKGKFTVELTYSCAPNAGGNYIFTAGTARLEGHADPTAGWDKWKTVKVGTITVTQDGETAFLKANGQPQNALMNVLHLRLIPQ